MIIFIQFVDVSIKMIRVVFKRKYFTYFINTK